MGENGTMKRWGRFWSGALLAVLLLCLCGCGNGKETATNLHNEIIVDSIGREIALSLPVRKAVVANSHNTELINAVGAINCVIGVDSGIYHDQTAYRGRFKENQLIGQNQRALNYEKIIELAPEVLIISGNGNRQDAEKKLGAFGIQVIVLNAYYTDQFQANSTLLGKLFGREREAAELVHYFDSKLAYIRKQLDGKPKKTLYVEYRRQNTTVIPSAPYGKMVEYSGAKNIFDDAKNPQVVNEAIVLRNPDYILKVSEENVRGQYTPPSPEEFVERKRKLIERPGWDEISAVKQGKILLLSHYGFGGAAELVGTMYLAKFLYPEYLPDLHPEEIFKEWVTKYQRLDYISGHTYPAFRLEN